MKSRVSEQNSYCIWVRIRGLTARGCRRRRCRRGSCPARPSRPAIRTLHSPPPSPSHQVVSPPRLPLLLTPRFGLPALELLLALPRLALVLAAPPARETHLLDDERGSFGSDTNVQLARRVERKGGAPRVFESASEGFGPTTAAAGQFMGGASLCTTPPLMHNVGTVHKLTKDNQRQQECDPSSARV